MSTVRFLDTETVTLEELLGNGKRYVVPAFQRDYSWRDEQLDDLWLDLAEAPNTGLPHYMGPLVLLREADHLKVIDGQQRLATLTILCLVVLERLKKLQTPEDQQRYELLKSQFVGAKDPASLRWSSKLSLNENDDAFFQGTLVNHRQPADVAKLRASEKRLWSAHAFLAAKLDEKFGPSTAGEELVRFFQTVARRLAFTQITVEDELNAYTVFETLNARSLRLTSTDLLKNYLFSLLKTGVTDLAQGKSQWNRVLSFVEFEMMPTFLRHYLASRQPLVRTERLFKELRQQVRTREDAFSLLDELERHAIWYRALDDWNDEFWRGPREACREHVRVLRLFGVEQFKPLVLAAIRTNLPPTELERILRACVMVSVRYHVIGKRNPNQAEASYNEAAMELERIQPPDAGAAISRLRRLYVDDDEFTAEFSTYSAHTRGRNARLTKYLLFALERQLGGPDLDFETAEETVEHVLPRSLTPEWERDFSSEDHERFVGRLGNLAILKPGQNNDLGRMPYDEKKKVLAASGYKLSTGITAGEWTPASIRTRQEQLAKVARTVWRIDFPPERPASSH
ncbi:MAG: DUF262 domain-containing HNH endonuclease family protein [Myxococcota bacterium]|jgi:hypothetical protein